jgi:hypothetical protein
VLVAVNANTHLRTRADFGHEAESAAAEACDAGKRPHKNLQRVDRERPYRRSVIR